MTVPTIARANPLQALLLPTSVDERLPDRVKWQRKFDLRMGAALKKSKVLVQSPGRLTVPEWNCQTADCFEGLAVQRGVDLVVEARVELGAQPNYRVSVWLYDRAKPGSVRKSRSDCVACTDSQASERLVQLVEKVLDDSNESLNETVGPPLLKVASSEREATPSAARAERPLSVHSESPSEPPAAEPIDVERSIMEAPNRNLSSTPPSDSTPMVHKWLSRSGRVALQGVGLGLVGVGLGGVVWGAVEAIHNGERTTRNGQVGTFDTSVARDVFLSVGTLSLVGGAAMALAGWLVPEGAEKSVRWMPVVSPTSAWLQLEWTY